MRTSRGIACVLAAIMLAWPALAEPSLEEKGLSLGDSGVSYPVVTGLEDAALETAVNDRIVEAGGIAAYLDRLALVFSSPAGLHVTWEADDTALAGDVLSCVITAEGALEDTRRTEKRHTINLDLRDGSEIGWDRLFTDPEAALEGIAAMLEDEVAPDLSAHLAAAELTPVPDSFTLSSTGLTLWYPLSQLATLQDHAGSVKLMWYQVAEWLLTGEDDIPTRVGALNSLTLTSLDDVKALTVGGTLPDVPAALNDSMQSLTDAFGMLTDPDLDQQGRVFALDGAAFRDVLLMTDSLTRDWEHSVVQGIRSTRFNLAGLITGKTDRTEWLETFGEPSATIMLDEEAAEAQLLAAGTSDYYELDGCRLLLHADLNGVLSCLFILP